MSASKPVKSDIHSLTTGRFPFGTVYLIDPQLDSNEKRRNLETIRHELNFNTVVLWPACSRWDADEPGGMAFDSVDEVMDICAELDLAAILEFQGQNPSFQERPESAMIDPETWVPNARDIRINHPQYLDATLTYMRQVAEHFKGHPALLAYDIFNEIGNQSFDIWTLREFVRFLRERYDDSITRLNDAWCCFFANFDQIATLPPDFNRWNWSSMLARRDWEQFRSWNFAERMKDWTAAIRQVDPDVIILADALGCDTMHTRPSGYFGVTDWDIAENVEVLGLSCYGNMIGKRWWEVDAWRWAQWWRSSLSAAGDKQAMISEMMTQNRTLFPWEGSSMTDQVGLWSMQAMLHGVSGLIYWKFRPFRRGRQVGGRGLTDYDAVPNSFGRQAADAARFVERNAETLAGLKPDPAGCAILHDHNAQDLLATLIGQQPDLYTDSVSGIFRGFWRHGVSPMFLRGADVAAAGVPDWVKVLAVPVDIAVSQAVADALAAFVAGGGVLLTESRFGLLNENCELWNHVPGGGLFDTLGLEEHNLTARFCGRLAVGGAELVFDHDFVQQFTCKPDVDMLAVADTSDPILVARKVGKGLYLHAACLLGSLIHNERPGAAELFDLAWRHIEGAVDADVKVVEKPERCDVSILLGKADRRPGLIGVTNYETTDATVVVTGPVAVDVIDGIAPEAVKASDGRIEITVPARSAAAVFLK